MEQCDWATWGYRSQQSRTTIGRFLCKWWFINNEHLFLTQEHPQIYMVQDRWFDKPPIIDWLCHCTWQHTTKSDGCTSQTRRRISNGPPSGCECFTTISTSSNTSSQIKEDDKNSMASIDRWEKLVITLEKRWISDTLKYLLWRLILNLNGFYFTQQS